MGRGGDAGSGAGTASRDGRRLAGRRSLLIAAATFLVLPSAVVAAGGGRSYADASAPPPFSSLPAPCPGPSNPAKGAAADAAPVPYGVPFRAIVFGGEIKVSPYIVIPHIYATACGEIQLPQLTGTTASSTVKIATPNIYIAGLEAFPSSVDVKTMTTAFAAKAAPNGGLDLTVAMDAVTSVSTLGMTCNLPLPLTLTTRASGQLEGRPATGPTQSAEAEVVNGTFQVPAIAGSESGTCPPAVAQSLNHLLHLPAPVGAATFTLPLCFDFELEKTSIPAATPSCPWPSS